MVGYKPFPLHHVFDSSRSSNSYIGLFVLKYHSVLSGISSSNKGFDFDGCELADSNRNVEDLVGQFASWGQDQTLDIWWFLKQLKGSDKKSGSFSCSRLPLDDTVLHFQDGRNALFLNGWWLFVTIPVNSSNKFVFEFKILKIVVNLLYTLLSLIW